jgi:tRNA(Ile)-lysidine synthase
VIASPLPLLARVAVAASGGPDSTALLHATARAAQALGVEVVALHVHHGLMPQADAWLAHVHDQARRWKVGFDSRRLQSAPASGDSVEAWARRGRWAALADMARSNDVGLVLLAQHRRDQAETWLLQALRGGGPAGLSAMPSVVERDGITWARPWLDQPREAIEAYLKRHRLRSVSDSSNADARFARARLRTAVWPALLAAFPDAEVALSRSALRAQEAAAVLDEVAADDLVALLHEGALRVAEWKRLSAPRRAQALRRWLGGLLPNGAPESLIQRLEQELLPSRAARWPAGPGWLLLRKGSLRFEMSAE